MLKNNRTGQTSLEYAVVLMVIIGALLAMQNYIKRGIQGRWRDAVDDMGDQYDPRAAITSLNHTLSSSTNTAIIAISASDGYWTKRTDVSASTERNTGTSEVGAY